MSMKIPEPTNCDDCFMEKRYLRARLAAAENVAALYGWTGSQLDTDRDRGLHEMWRAWKAFPGVVASPEALPHLSDWSLAFVVDQANKYLAAKGAR